MNEIDLLFCFNILWIDFCIKKKNCIYSKNK